MKKSNRKIVIPSVSALVVAAVLGISAIFGGGNASESKGAAPAASFSNVENDFEVHFIDVGQGDSELIICDGEAMLIDGGPSKSSSVVYTYLKKRNITELKYMIATHTDEDHIGGLSGALNYANVHEAFCSEGESDTRAWKSFVKYLGQEGVTLQIPENNTKLKLGSADVSMYLPENRGDHDDNWSIVTRVTYGDTSFLFTGDCTGDEEKVLLSSGVTLGSDVLKVAHHGSKSSSSQKFLNKVSATYAIISCSKDNNYGHPHEETLDRLEKAGAIIYQTKEKGDIVFSSDGKEVSVR